MRTLMRFVVAAAICVGACRRTPTTTEAIHAEPAADAAVDTDADADADADARSIDVVADDGPAEEVRTAERMDGPFVDHVDVCKHAAASCRVGLEADHVDAGDEDASVAADDCACATKNRRAVAFPGIRAAEIVEIDVDGSRHEWLLAVQTTAGWWVAPTGPWGGSDVGAGNATVDVLDSIAFSVEPIDATPRKLLVGRVRIAGRRVRSLGMDVAHPPIARRSDAMLLCDVDPSGVPLATDVAVDWLDADAPYGLKLPGDGTVEVAPGIWGPMGDPVVDVRFP